MQDNREEAGQEIVVHVDPEIADLVPGYLEKRRKDLLLMEQALQRGGFEEILDLGHKAKGSGEAYGFEGLSAIGRSLEKAAMERDSREVRKRLDELSAYLKRVRVVYDGS